MIRRIVRFLLIFTGFVGLIPSALAQSYPNRALEVMLPFAESSLASQGFTVLAGASEKINEQEIRVVYKPGEKRHNFWRDVDSILDDGYTYAQFRTPEYFLLSLMGKATYQPREQQPVVVYQCESHGLFVRKNSTVKNVEDLLQQLRRDGDIAEISGEGLGSWGHLAHLKFIDEKGLKTVYRAFDKPEQARQAVGNEEATAYWGRASEALGDGVEGLRILALAAETRHPFLPYVPLFKESGVELLSSNCWGLMLPETTDSEKAKIFSKQIAKINKDGQYRHEIHQLALEPNFVGFREVGDNIWDQQKEAEKLLKKYGFIEE